MCLRRRALPDYAAEGTGIDAEAPRCALLSNGTYCLAVSEAGQSFARWHALSVCRRGTRADPAAGPVVQLETDDFSGPLLPGTAAGAQWRFTVRAAQFTARHGDVTAVQTLTVPGRANGEVRALTLSSPRGIEGTVRFVFEAVLAPWDDYVNHPAFARLGFQSVLRRNALLLRRLGRGGKPETWLCAACDQQADFCAEGALPGWLRAGYVQVRVAVHTPPDTPWRVRFALGVGARWIDGVFFNVLAVFVISYLVQYISIERTQALTIVMIAALLMCPFILIAGRLADRYGRGMVYGVSSLLCGLSIFPSFWLMEGSGGSLFLIALAIIIPISVFYAGVFGPEAALFSDLFPPDVRYTGISIVYQFPGFLVAGIVPGLCTFLINWNEGDPLYVCLFTLLAAVTSALSAFAIQRKSIAAQRKHGDDAEHI